MKRLLIILLCLTPLHANAQSSKSTVVSAINADFADNTAGAITAALLRSVSTQIVSSYVDWQTCGIQGGIIYYAAGISPTCLSPGTAGQFLRTYTTPAWESLAGVLTAGSGIGISGTITPTIAVSDTELNNLQNLNGSTGILARTGSVSPVYVARTLTGTINQITFTNGNGVSGNPTAVLSNLTIMLDAQFGSTQGGVIYRGASSWAFLSPGTSGQVFTTGGSSTNPSYTTVAGTGTVTSILCGTGLTCGGSNPITNSGTITPTFATGAQFQANNVTGVVDVGTPWAAAVPIVLSPAAVVTPNFSTGINYTITVTGNVIIGNPSNQKVGQTGCIFLTQGASVTGTVSAYSNWLMSGGSITASNALNSNDALCYMVKSVSSVYGTFSTNFK